MAELAISALLSSGLATSTVGAAGALGTLQSVFTVGSMVSTLVGGFASYRDGQSQARFAEINATGERLAAEEKSIRIRRELVQRIGQNRVAFAGSGLDLSSAGAIEGALRTQASSEERLAFLGGEMGAASSRTEAASYRSRGSMALINAAVRAGGQYVDLRLDQRERGGPERQTSRTPRG